MILGQIRTFFARLRHRDAVMETLAALLLFYPRGRQFARDFPALKPTILADFKAGVPPPVSALRLAVGIVENFINQLQPEEKAAALRTIAETGRTGFGEFAAERIRRRRGGTERDRAGFAARLAGVAIFMATRMSEEGTLRPDDQTAFIARIEAALDPSAPETHPLADVFKP